MEHLDCACSVPVNNSGAEYRKQQEPRLFERPTINLAYSLDEKRRMVLEHIIDIMFQKMVEIGRQLVGPEARLEEKNFNRYRVHDFYKIFWYIPEGREKERPGFKIEFSLFKKIGEGMNTNARIVIYTKWQPQLQPIMDRFRKEANKLDINCQWSMKRPQSRLLTPKVEQTEP
jgi:hypothetical protein